MRQVRLLFMVGVAVALASGFLMLLAWSGGSVNAGVDLDGPADAMHDLASSSLYARRCGCRPALVGHSSGVLSLACAFVVAHRFLVAARAVRTFTLEAARRNHSLVDAGHCFKQAEGHSNAACLPSLICIGAMKVAHSR
jgi:hypothetical protein